MDGNPTSRLTLQTVLRASGYSVDAAASAAEAYSWLDRKVYELVLSDLAMESPEAGLRVLAHARFKEYAPATALITSSQNGVSATRARTVLIQPEDIPGLLERVADIISERATRRVERELRMAAVV